MFWKFRPTSFPELLAFPISKRQEALGTRLSSDYIIVVIICFADTGYIVHVSKESTAKRGNKYFAIKLKISAESYKTVRVMLNQNTISCALWCM